MPRGGARPNSGPKKGYKREFPLPETPYLNLADTIDSKLKIEPHPIPPAPLVSSTVAPDMQAITRRKTPLEWLYDMMKNSRVPWPARVAAAKAAAEYVHAKQPQAVHVTSEVRIGAVVVHVEAGTWNDKKEKELLPPETVV